MQDSHERGSRLELTKSDFTYFCDVLQRFEEESFEDEEEKQIFLENVMKATKGLEVDLCCHSRLSSKLEKLLREIPENEHLAAFVSALSEHFGEISTDRSASNILQTLLAMSLNRLSVESKVSQWVISYSKFVEEHLEELLENVYASHVICTLFETLSGCRVSKAISKSKKSKRTDETASYPERVEVPRKYRKVLNRIVSKLSESSILEVAASRTHSNIVVQTAVMVLRDTDKEEAHEFVDVLLGKLFSTDFKLTACLTDPHLSRLLETVIGAVSDDQFDALLQQHFIGKMQNIVMHRISNFVGQRLLQRCSSKDMLEKLFEELCPAWEQISEVKHLGVLLALCEACSRLNCCQAKFISRLAELLGCSETQERRALLSEAVLKWLPFDELSRTKDFGKVNYHGSMLIQSIFGFQKPNVIVDSLLGMDLSKLCQMACDPVGSHVFDAYFKSKTVGGKKRLQMVEKLKGEFVALATNKFAARCVETVWKCVDVKAKQIIAQDLSEQHEKLRNHPAGYAVAKFTAVELYRRSPKEWNEFFAKSEKKGKIVEEILENRPKKRKRNQ